jgi:hypothetical protein
MKNLFFGKSKKKDKNLSEDDKIKKELEKELKKLNKNSSKSTSDSKKH